MFTESLALDVSDLKRDPRAELPVLLREARRGRQDACARLVRLFEGVVMKTALAMTGQTADAQDVAQEVFLRFFGALDRIDPERNVRAWLRRSTVRVCLDLLEKRKRELPAGSHLLEALPDTRVSGFAKQPLAKMLLALTDRERAAFLLVYQFGYGTSEAGKVMHCSGGTVKTLCFRARGKLRAALQKEEVP